MHDAAGLDFHAAGMRRTLITPEGVDLSLGLAGGGQRVAAFLFDLSLMLLSLIVLTAAAAGIGVYALRGEAGGALELVAALWLLGFFLIRNFYFILFEGGGRAATLGKRALGLRVVARSGERLSLESVVARNLMREIEVYLPLSYLGWSLFGGAGDPLLRWLGAGWVLLFLLFPWFNKDRLRVGDLLAGTWVVRVPRRRLARDLAHGDAAAPPPRSEFTPGQLAAYGVFELQTLERVLRGSDANTLDQVAATIRRKIGAWGPPGDARAFLTAYYAQARAHLERELLFGRRKADKFDS